ncbi:MAG: nucleoside-diphosphate kinase [Verrucomicrobia bacterium]|nr:nucleoside-diphosphate kinase [Verrucomicrobiota bacterium]MDA1085913.1 nucleoside-diphosphate kinase [Verrucomicrobiota bacterium]
MADKELAFTLINPATLAKSRSGGIIARYMSRTGLELVGARMFAPGKALASAYAALAGRDGFYPARTAKRMSEYIRTQYAPDAQSGRPRRVMMLLFEGKDAVRKVSAATGNPQTAWKSGDTIRGTFGDLVTDAKGRDVYFEPAVLVGPDVRKTREVLKLWSAHSQRDGGIVDHAGDVPRGKGVQSTLVMLKPDNFRFPNLRAGQIIDVLSRSGLHIVGAKKFSMTVAQAEEFYGPVRAVLRDKLSGRFGEQAREILEKELGYAIPHKAAQTLTRLVGPLGADNQFEAIVEFMTGYRPSEVDPDRKTTLGKEHELALIYRGPNAVPVIRDILGPTDPSKAPVGTVRKEFGKNIMVNATHASDSTRNSAREIKILNVAEDTISPLVNKYYR